MQRMLLMISSETPGGETAVEPARAPIQKPASHPPMIISGPDSPAPSRP